MSTVNQCTCTSVKPAINNQHIVAFFLLAVITGCSGSGSGSPPSDDTVAVFNTVPNTSVNIEEISPVQSETTRVTFNITVPAYMSDTLQVRLLWGGKELEAKWVKDESWTLTEDFPIHIENPLIVSFNDANGLKTLATYTADFQAKAFISQQYNINANQFDSNSWDDNGDGISNLTESIAGNNQPVEGSPDAVQATLELVPNKAFRLTWQRSAAAQYYRILENPDGLSGFIQVGDDVDASVLSYNHRVALYNRVNASYIVQACNGVGCSESTILTVPSSLESAITYIKASNTETYDLLGAAIALTRDGNMLAVGAPGESSASTQINGNENDNDARSAGAVYIFERIGSAWQQMDYIKASNAQAGDSFGSAVEISADGTTLVVGAPYEDSFTVDLSDGSNYFDERYGSVYVFTRNGGTWLQQSYLKPDNPTYQSAFGGELSLSADGNTLAVGVAFESSGVTGVNSDLSSGSYAYRSGAAYIFGRVGDNWAQQAHIKASNAQGGHTDQDGEFYGGDNFGYAVSLSGDGNNLAVGAHQESSNALGIDGDQMNNLASFSGAVYTFTRTGTSWQQQAYIKASNTEKSDGFGAAVSLNHEGDTLAVYASGEDSIAAGIGGDQTDNSADNTGALYLFSQSGGTWQQQAYIKSSTSDTELGNVTSRSISDDGKVLAFGNTVYTHRDASWQLQVDLQSISGNDKVYNGRAVVSGDGNTIAIGDTSDESSSTGLNGDRYDYFADRSGAVYLY